MVNHYLNFKFPLNLLLFIQIFLIISFPIKLSFLIIYILIYIPFDFFFFSEKLVNFYVFSIKGLSVSVSWGQVCNNSLAWKRDAYNQKIIT